MDRSVIDRISEVSIYVNSFVIGGVVMGFEMLGSRYLYPYFGGGIGTWAGLISTVLSALTIGYLAGGSIADRYPSSRVLAAASALASVYLVLIPLTADHVMSWILNVIGDGPWGILVAAAGLLLLPLSFLGTFSPIAIRLLVHSARASGRVAGLVYGISTVGSVFGTLFTTFTLIPTIGSRSITYLYACILAVSAASLYINYRRAP